MQTFAVVKIQIPQNFGKAINIEREMVNIATNNKNYEINTYIHTYVYVCK